MKEPRRGGTIGSAFNMFPTSRSHPLDVPSRTAEANLREPQPGSPTRAIFA